MLSRLKVIGVAVLLLSLPAKSQDFGDDYTSKRHALGLKVRYPVGGFNYLGWLHRQVGVEALGGLWTVGIAGSTVSIKMVGIALRGRTKYTNQIFPYGGIGLAKWYEEYELFDTISKSTRRLSNTAEGFSVFIGIEYFRPEIPSMGFDVEVGYGSITLQSITLGKTYFGGGIHVYF